MYNKCCCVNILTKNSRAILREETLSPLLQPILLSFFILFLIDCYYQHSIELTRRCNCRSMIRFRIELRQISTNDMLVNIINHANSNRIHFNNEHF